MKFAWASDVALSAVFHSSPPTLSIAVHPFGRSLIAHVESRCSGFQRTALLKHISGHLLSTMNGQSGILVIVHSIPPGNLIRRRTSFSQSDRMDNLLKLHI